MKVTKALIDKFSEGKCTPEEELAVRQWLEDGAWPDEEGDAATGEAIWNRMQEHRYPDTPIIPMQKRGNAWWKIAAAILLLLSMGTTSYFLLYKKHHIILVSTTNEERKKVVLPDNSVVFLSKGSTLRYPEKFPGDKREIWLIGEGTFEVAKDARRPFTVISEQVRTTALGTSFKVSAYPGAHKVDVALSYGKVVVCREQQTKTDSVYLDPGEAVVYTPVGKTVRKTTNAQFNYKENVLYFDHANMEEVITKLENFYGIKILTADQLRDAKWQVSGEFNREPLDVVMKNIAFTCDVSYRINQDTLIIAPTER